MRFFLSFKGFTLVGIPLLLLLTFLTYSPILTGEFVFWDDYLYLVDNPIFDQENPLSAIWVRFETPSYYPITFSLYYLQKEIFGLDPTKFHWTNLLLHLVNIMLFWLVLSKMKLSVPVSILATFLYALHPVQTETVAWISELKNLLCATFYWLSFFCFLSYLEHKNHSFYGLSLTFFLAALLSKSMAVTLPISLFWWLLLFKKETYWNSSRLLLPFFGVALLIGTIAIQQERKLYQEGQEQLLTRSFSEIVHDVTQATWFYPYKLLLPFQLSPVYPRNPISSFWSYFALTALILWLLALFYFRNKIPKLLLFSLVNYGIIASPILGFLSTTYHSVSIVSDRYHYHPTSFLMISVAFIIVELAKRLKALPLRLFMFLPLIALVPLTWKQVHIWQNSLNLWQQAYKVTPTHPVVLNNLGVTYWKAEEMIKAEEIFKKYTNLYQKAIEPKSKYGRILFLNKKFEKAEEVLREVAQKRNGSYGTVHYYLGKCFQRKQMNQQALEQYKMALASKTPEFKAFIPLGFLLLKANKNAEAKHCFQQAQKGNFEQEQIQLGLGLCHLKEFSIAKNHFNKALLLAPKNKEIYLQIRNFYVFHQKYQEAFAILIKGLSILPQAESLRIQLIWDYLLCPNNSFQNVTAAAKQLQILEKTSKSKEILIIKAVIFRAQKNYPHGIRLLKQVLKQSLRKEKREKIERLMNAYRIGSHRNF